MTPRLFFTEDGLTAKVDVLSCAPCDDGFAVVLSTTPFHPQGGGCSGLMKPDTHLGENARHIEVSDDQATSCLFR